MCEKDHIDPEDYVSRILHKAITGEFPAVGKEETEDKGE